MLRTVFSVIATMIISFFAGWFAHGAFGDVYVGTAEALDGSTLRVGRSEFELLGISSPDITTDLGVEAKDYLSFVMTDQFVWCRHEGDMNGERRLGKCYAGLENLNERMVAEGFARDCFAASDGEFAELEARARGMGRGMWENDRMPDAPEICRVAAIADDDVDPAEAEPVEELSDPIAGEIGPSDVEVDVPDMTEDESLSEDGELFDLEGEPEVEETVDETPSLEGPF